MRPRARLFLPALIALAALCPPAIAQAAGFGVKPGSFTASALATGGVQYTQAAGSPKALEIRFEVTGSSAGAGELAHVRLDLPDGLALDPQAAAAQCEVSVFEAQPAQQCPADSQIGSDELTLSGGHAVTASVYMLTPPSGLPGELGVYIPSGGPLTEAQHLLVQVRVSPADFHEYLQLEVPTELAVTASALKLEDASGAGLVTLPSICTAPGWALTLQSGAGTSESASYESPALQGCSSVPFSPSLSVKQGSTADGQPTGIAASASLPATGSEADIARLRLALPSGMALNVPGLASLQPCTSAQAALAQEAAASCPSAAQIGTAAVLTRIAPEALSGAIYLAEGEGLTGGSATTQAQFPIYLELENARYGLAMHLKGTLAASRTDGALEVLLSEVPQLPISELQLALGGLAAPLVVNPTACGTEALQATLTPYTTLLAAPALAANTLTTGCPAHPPSTTQSTSDLTHQAGAPTSFSLAFSRGEPGLNFTKFHVTLPRGLVAHLPVALRCAEAQASLGQCPPASEIGVTSIAAGAGGSPLTLAGRVYLTASFDGAPFGVLLAIPATVGPFHLGELLVHAKLTLDSGSGQLELEGSMPRVLDGIPLRTQRISITINRSGLLYNPTVCGGVRAPSSLSGAAVSSSVSISGCRSLAFRPAVSAASSSTSSPSKGANLEASISIPHGESNVRSLLLQLPRQFIARASTLAGACAEATFKANPNACPAGSFVGTASATTPMLGARLSGPAILAIASQTKLPELFLVLQAEGVRVILSGSFRSVNGITFLAFGSEPDIPLSQLSLKLAGGTHSVLTLEPRAGICQLPLSIPTYLTAWNKKEAKLDPAIRPVGCGVRIVGHKVIGDAAYLTVQTFSAGRISGSGAGIHTVYRRLSAAKRAVGLRVPLSSRARHRHRAFNVRLRVGFVPAHKAAPSFAYVTVSFH